MDTAPASPSASIELGETVRLVNRGDTPLLFMWNSRSYLIPENGGDTWMPFDGAKVYLGDPRATDNIRSAKDSMGLTSFIPDRDTEVRRLRQLYNAPFGEYMSTQSATGIFANPKATRTVGKNKAFDGVRIPDVEMYNQRGQRIMTVLDDPDGIENIPVTVTRSFTDEQRIIIEQQGNLIRIMADKLGIPADQLGSMTVDQSILTSPVDQPPEPDAPDIEVNEDGSPKMVYDTRANEVRTRRRSHVPDPVKVDDLPEDE